MGVRERARRAWDAFTGYPCVLDFVERYGVLAQMALIPIDLARVLVHRALVREPASAT